MNRTTIFKAPLLSASPKSYRWIYRAVGLLLMFSILVGSTYAQSKDRDNPTRLTSNEITGTIGGNLGDDYYYTFAAGPGELTITVSVEAGRDASISFNVIGFDLFDEDARRLASRSQSANLGRTEQGVVRFQLNRRHRLLLRITIPEVNYGMGTGKYRLRLGGSVETNTSTNTATDTGVDVNTLSSFNDANGDCLPKKGTLILKMKDGSKKIIDLSEAETVTIVP